MSVQLANPGLQLTLLVPRRMVAAVLAEIALLARLGDLLGNLGSSRALKMIELTLELVVRLLGQPDRLRRILRHRTSVPSESTRSLAWTAAQCTEFGARTRTQWGLQISRSYSP